MHRIVLKCVATLHRYSSGRTTGLVLDSGDGVTHSVPVFEGFSMPNAIRRIDLAGRDVTDQLQLLMRGAGYDMRTSAEKEVVRGLKEEGCYVRSSSAAAAGSSGSNKDDGMRSTEEFKLPDGNVIKVSRFGALHGMHGTPLTDGSMFHDLPCTARRGKIPCSRDSVQPGSHRVGIPGRPSAGGGQYQSSRLGLAEESFQQCGSQRRHNTDER